jgi:hypothetical protein
MPINMTNTQKKTYVPFKNLILYKDVTVLLESSKGDLFAVRLQTNNILVFDFVRGDLGEVGQYSFGFAETYRVVSATRIEYKTIPLPA